jgi:hypothetical protein
MNTLRRGDGVGIEVLPNEIRAVRLQQDVPGRVAAVAVERCDSRSDAAVDVALRSLHQRIGAGALPARIAVWPAGSQVQSIDITGWEPIFLRAHRNMLDDVAATVEVAIGARRWLSHVRWDSGSAQRLSRLATDAGFAVQAVDPSPMAVARVVDTTQVALHAARDAANPWFAIVLDRVVLVAIPMGDSKQRRDVGDLTVVANASNVEEVRSRLSSATRLPSLVGDLRFDPAVRRLPLALGNEPYPEFAHTDPANAASIGVALGAAFAAAGLAGRVQSMVPTNSQRGLSEAESIWVVEPVTVDETGPQGRPRRRWLSGLRATSS